MFTTEELKWLYRGIDQLRTSYRSDPDNRAEVKELTTLQRKIDTALGGVPEDETSILLVDAIDRQRRGDAITPEQQRIITEKNAEFGLA